MEPRVLDLWPGKPPGQAALPGKDTILPWDDGNIRLTDVTRPQVCIIGPVKWVKDTGTALVIAPGGGYAHLGWEYEAELMAAWLNERGVTAGYAQVPGAAATGEPEGRLPGWAASGQPGAK